MTRFQRSFQRSSNGVPTGVFPLPPYPPGRWNTAPLGRGRLNARRNPEPRHTVILCKRKGNARGCELRGNTLMALQALPSSPIPFSSSSGEDSDASLQPTHSFSNSLPQRTILMTDSIPQAEPPKRTVGRDGKTYPATRKPKPEHAAEGSAPPENAAVKTRYSLQDRQSRQA